uniref:selenocysteine-specific translation elongation factor n=1 Tax=Sutcliffiella deserti TaxID=2875501 RepID=UPI0021E00932
MTKHFTIGMAGHIDHGKTTLTKALTGVDTDRLKEEKERQISIELGYAPLYLEGSDSVASIVDVPGHERFIRQMIAGVSGIDLVMLVIAADEGVMPQTKEHLEILKFLKIQKGIIVITKMDKVDPDILELAKEEILDELEDSIFQNAPVVFVDSMKNQGMKELKRTIEKELDSLMEKQITGSFRLPIDQVFTITGQGTIVRGTIVEGFLSSGDTLEVLPEKKTVKVRQLQVHGKQVESASAGQRVAVNIPNIKKEDIQRGDVLVKVNTYETTDTIDVALKFVGNLLSPIKQRSLLKVHTGTSEVLGKIIFFDRNEVSPNETGEVLCQLRLQEPITCKRDDKIIIRRPSPIETIGGGWVFQAKGKKYKFGKGTIDALMNMKQGSPEERVNEIFTKQQIIPGEQLQRETGLTLLETKALKEEGIITMIRNYDYALVKQLKETEQRIVLHLEDFHHTYSLRIGIAKAQLLSELIKISSKEILDYLLLKLEETGRVVRVENMISLKTFSPDYPIQWKKRMEQVEQSILKDRLTPKPFKQYSEEAGLPEKEAADLQYFLLKQNKVLLLNENYLINKDVFQEAVSSLREKMVEEMELSDIKDALQLSRKYLIPFVELMDRQGITERDGTKRKWIVT